MKRKVLLSILILFFVLGNAQEFVNNTTLSNEALAKKLSDCGCVLAKKGAKGLEDITNNLILKGKNSNGHSISTAAIGFCAHIGIDKTKYIENEFNDIPNQSTSLKRINKELLKACFPSKFHSRFDKEVYPRFKPKDLIPLGAIMSKVFSKNLNCYDSGRHYVDGNMFFTVFEKRLFSLADFMISEIEKQLGKENTLTISDITTRGDLNYLKKVFCDELRAGNKKDEADIKRYLKKFYGSYKCTKYQKSN